MKTILAVDPGAGGGIAVKREDQPVAAFAMSVTEGDLLGLLRELVGDPDYTLAIIEEVSGYAGVAQPGSYMFRFGRNFGFLLGVLQCLGVRVELVKPQKWQKALSLGSAANCASKYAWKAKLKSHAQRLYPQLKVTLSTCDALLLLEYALTKHRASGDKGGRVTSGF